MRISFPKVAFGCLLLVGTGYGVTVMRGPHGFAGLAEKRRQIELLEKQNEDLHRQIAAKREKLGRLEKNPDELALEIQERLKLVKPNSTVYILQDGTSVDPSQSGASPSAPANIR